MQIRHNLVVPEKPFFRRGSCVAKEAHYLFAMPGDGKIWAFQDEKIAARLGADGVGGICGGMRRRMAARA
jgi:hypothetical protein